MAPPIRRTPASTSFLVGAPPSLSSLFLTAASGDNDGGGGGPELDATLAGMFEAGRQAFPELAVDVTAFVHHLAHLTEGSVDRLAPGHAADLYLACAAALGQAPAIAEIEQRHLPQALAAAARISTTEADRDDIAQMVREKLFVADSGAAPAIAEYAGRGPLGGWIRVIVVRTALGLKRTEKRTDSVAPEDDALLDLPAATHPELDHIRSRYRAEFKESFQEALASLAPRERNLLRMHFIDGLNIDELGALHRVHRATVARWIARLREELDEETRRRLSARLGLNMRELDSIVALVQSQVDISLHRFLKAE